MSAHPRVARNARLRRAARRGVATAPEGRRLREPGYRPWLYPQTALFGATLPWTLRNKAKPFYLFGCQILNKAKGEEI